MTCNSICVSGATNNVPGQCFQTFHITLQAHRNERIKKQQQQPCTQQQQLLKVTDVCSTIRFKSKPSVVSEKKEQLHIHQMLVHPLAHFINTLERVHRNG